jgi:hypothetical protein
MKRRADPSECTVSGIDLHSNSSLKFPLYIRVQKAVFDEHNPMIARVVQKANCQDPGSKTGLQKKNT